MSAGTAGMEQKRFVAYYRVSTRAQSRSGLGLEAQRETVRAYCSEHGELVQEFLEVASGRKDQRIGLANAIRASKAARASLVIARLDRFSRRVSFIASIMESGISLVVADMPGATEFQLHIFAALAQEERRLISERTKKALAQAKLRGVQLGVNGATLANRNRVAANDFALKIAHQLPDGWQTFSYSEIARHLNGKGVQTFSGRSFFPQTVKAVIIRLRSYWDGGTSQV